MRPRWKEAALTWIGVNITAFALAFTLSRLTAEWSWVAAMFAFNTAMVAGLTWPVMPALIWLARNWLDSPHGDEGDGQRRTDSPQR